MEQCKDLSSWIPMDGDTGVIQYIDFSRCNNPTETLFNLLRTLPEDIQDAVRFNGNIVSADLSVWHTIVNTPAIMSQPAGKSIRFTLMGRYPEMFCEQNVTLELSLEEANQVKLLSNYNDDTSFKEGYRAFACVEPLILEPEDWSEAEWEVLCKLCGLTGKNAVRIVMNTSSIEAYLDPKETPTFRKDD